MSELTGVTAQKVEGEEGYWQHFAACPICSQENMATFWCWDINDHDYIIDGELLCHENLVEEESSEFQDWCPHLKSVRFDDAQEPTLVKFMFEIPPSMIVPHAAPRCSYTLGID